MSQIDPAILFALGALCMLTVTLIVALALVFTLGAKLWSFIMRHASVFDDFGASREDGMVHLGAHLIDIGRHKPRPARKMDSIVKPNGTGRERLS